MISFADIYKKVASNVGRIPGFSIEQDFANSENAYALADYLSDVANDCGMSIQSCAEEVDLQRHGISHGKCIDDVLIRNLFSLAVSGKKDKGQRLPCGCVESIDIGQYNTCLHGCQYCYATTSQSSAQRNYEKHNPRSPFLVGNPIEEEEGDDREGICSQGLLF